MPLIVGLGNPGTKYAKTRHNAGFLVLDELAKQLKQNFSKKADLNAEVAETNVDGKKVVLAKPMTFMNNSGEAIQKLARQYKFAPCDVWVVYDDAAIAFGSLRVRLEGSDGGHNGIKSVIKHLNAQDFVRMRIGIGAPEGEMAMEDWVLGKFSKTELDRFDKYKKGIARRINASIISELESVTENLS